MNTKDIGTLGEHIGIAELLKYGITVSRPLGDNVQYDLILDIKGNLLKCQTKSKTTGTFDKVEFSLNTSNSSGSRVRYNNIDCYMLVDISNNKIFLVDYHDDRVSIIIRYIEPKKTNQYNYHMYTDYSIDKFIESLP